MAEYVTCENFRSFYISLHRRDCRVLNRVTRRWRIDTQEEGPTDRWHQLGAHPSPEAAMSAALIRTINKEKTYKQRYCPKCLGGLNQCSGFVPLALAWSFLCRPLAWPTALNGAR